MFHPYFGRHCPGKDLLDLLLYWVRHSMGVLATLLLWGALATTARAELPTIDLYAGMHRIQTEVASAPAERTRGLMGRRSLPENHGMLFVFERANVQCFWMRGTFVPLSIAFLRDDGSITNIADMQPLTEVSHCSSEPVRLALEVNQGWFAKRGITPGATIRGIPARP